MASVAQVVRDEIRQAFSTADPAPEQCPMTYAAALRSSPPAPPSYYPPPATVPWSPPQGETSWCPSIQPPYDQSSSGLPWPSSRLLKPTSGVIEFPGGVGDAHNSTGFCQQFDVLFPDLTVREHLVYFGQLRNVDSEELNKSIDKTLEAVKLTDKACSFPSQLSGGMKRRLSISIALVARPKVLAVGG
ncbi:hypothetical protein HPB51_013413 [Rhipicephalus microplus]|uniref:ABC transporter domain-containing protein n=1 Tax=Rhipicephalus microplus TaxID=6941 RepID=A0A9J6D591_RHIMP|nr:hypothetical protein HPB51_013413 [Rhipicephalus microplus]